MGQISKFVFYPQKDIRNAIKSANIGANQSSRIQDKKVLVVEELYLNANLDNWNSDNTFHLKISHSLSQTAKNTFFSQGI